MKNLAPTATARVALRQTKAGKQILIVSVVTPDDVAFRTYEHEVGCEQEQAVANALRSLGLPSAWVWGSLPRHPHTPAESQKSAKGRR